MSAGNVETMTTAAEPERAGVTTRMMDLLEVLDSLQGQADSIIAVLLGHDSPPREASPVAVLDYQVDFAIATAREISDKLARVCRAL